MKKSYNYKVALEFPIYIQQITKNFYLPFPLRLGSIGVFVFVELMLLLPPFNYIVNVITGQFRFMISVLFIALPLGVVYLVNNLKIDGKKTLSFFNDYMRYFLFYKLSKKVHYKDRLIKLERSE